MTTYSPYFYIIGWEQLGWYYAGIETASITKSAHPSNLFRQEEGTRYTTSSKLVNRFVKWFGDPRVIEIVEFEKPEEAVKFEREFLILADIRSNSNFWLNRSVAGSPVATEDVRRKMRDAAKRRGPSKGKKGKIPWNKGKATSPETKAKLSKAKLGKTLSEEHKAKISAGAKGRESWNKGKSMSDEHKAKVSAAVTEWWSDRKTECDD